MLVYCKCLLSIVATEEDGRNGEWFLRCDDRRKKILTGEGEVWLIHDQQVEANTTFGPLEIDDLEELKMKNS